MADYSDEYVEHLMNGPFHERVDPWAEIGRYFHQIHAAILDEIIRHLRTVLPKKGYFISRKASLQLSGGREPDIFVRHSRRRSDTMRIEAYMSASEALLTEPGVEIFEEYDLGSLYIHDMDTHRLITVLEIISPSNKGSTAVQYRGYRSYLLDEEVNFVELDLTRSVQRMLESQVTKTYPYHIAIYLPGALPRVIGLEFAQPLKPFALPLKSEAIRIDTQQVYQEAYRNHQIATQIEGDQRYVRGELPFPSTLTTDQESAMCLTAFQHGWRNCGNFGVNLKALRTICRSPTSKAAVVSQIEVHRYNDGVRRTQMCAL